VLPKNAVGESKKSKVQSFPDLEDCSSDWLDLMRSSAIRLRGRARVLMSSGKNSLETGANAQSGICMISLASLMVKAAWIL
jgi:hypothetical protein